jgi:hypothetical protein
MAATLVCRYYHSSLEMPVRYMAYWSTTVTHLLLVNHHSSRSCLFQPQLENQLFGFAGNSFHTAKDCFEVGRVLCIPSCRRSFTNLSDILNSQGNLPEKRELKDFCSCVL